MLYEFVDQTEQSLSSLSARMDGTKAGQIRTMTCQICLQAEAKYSCPRCNSPYCGLKCYQSPGHRQCSETFYQECVNTELQAQGRCEPNTDTKSKMLESLKDD